MVEASCLEWAAVAAIVLRDAMAIIRIVNAARSAPDAPAVVRRLYDSVGQLCSAHLPWLPALYDQYTAPDPQLGQVYQCCQSAQQQQQRAVAQWYSERPRQP